MPKNIKEVASEISFGLDNNYFVWVDEVTDAVIIDCGYLSIGIKRNAIDDNIFLELVKSVVPQVGLLVNAVTLTMRSKLYCLPDEDVRDVDGRFDKPAILQAEGQPIPPRHYD